MKKCPFCAEEIQEAAIKCKHCGSMLNEPRAKEVTAAIASTPAPLIRASLPRPRIQWYEWPFRLVGAAFGLFGVLLSIVLMITVVGIPFGLLMMFGAMLIFSASIGRSVRSECPACRQTNAAPVGALNYQCRKCKQNVIIDWK